MDIVKTVWQAKHLIKSFDGKPEDFTLAISDELQNEIGLNMAIITDCIIGRGWKPNGFEQFNGYRIYFYKAMAL